jgi:hypothetical protein
MAPPQRAISSSTVIRPNTEFSPMVANRSIVLNLGKCRQAPALRRDDAPRSGPPAPACACTPELRASTRGHLTGSL